MYARVTPDSSFNLSPQTIHMSPKDPGCVHMVDFEDISAHKHVMINSTGNDTIATKVQ